MADEWSGADTLDDALTRIAQRQQEMEKHANSFANAMTGAFARAATSGRSFDDTLKAVALRLSDVALRMAIKPVASALTSSLGSLFGNLFDGFAGGAVKPFASGGVIVAPS